jgi:hypothetical protein
MLVGNFMCVPKSADQTHKLLLPSSRPKVNGWMDVCVSECTWMDEDKWDMQMPFDLIERQAINPKRISRRAHKIASLSTKCNHNATIFQNTCPFVQHAMHR